MGGCATKPKVLTGDGEAEAPAPAPAEPAKVEEAAAAEVKTETKEKGVEVVEEEKKVVEGDKVKEIVGEQEEKPRSLSNLFKENEGEAEAEPVKQEVSGTEKPKDESETKKPEAEPSSEPATDEPSEPEKPSEEPETNVAVKTEAPVEVTAVEQTTIPAIVVEVLPKAESEKVVDVTPTTAETQISEEKKTEESK
ncbi:gelsolin-related protein [Tripterygium wilfordii]|uniref:Gelsolin-related protein n=1 Tax=Tripterygium wilfordii TaxID=458696 RepID=A0A7J7DFX3_TRIWF|nr:phosphatidylglycerol--prolipoprotein diacylglyceryl transferase-like [Tripterygium wilfordii]KAF5745164.1 gelsolin-related protein [Tripterygium wilfordii]